mmetsp:Transcript_28376/g.91793  ORF Transcript_28376/g.91793 Transcript_28376/m.91793 type:complete len:812 (+) Transcript_28376:657-3092(+)
MSEALDARERRHSSASDPSGDEGGESSGSSQEDTTDREKDLSHSESRSNRGAGPDHGEKSCCVLPSCEYGCCAGALRPDGCGPMAKPRKCRDVACFALFVIAWVVWLLMFWVLATEGCPSSCNDPRRLIFGTDSVTGETCGTGREAGKPNVYFPDPVNPLSRRFCVSRCPSTLSDDPSLSISLGLYRGVLSSETKQTNCLTTDKHNSSCFFPTYPSINILWKCVPLAPKDLREASRIGFASSAVAYTLANQFIASPVGLLGDIISELQTTWRVMVLCAVGLVILCFLWLLFLRVWARYFVVFLIVSLLLGSIYASYLAWRRAGMFSSSDAVSRQLGIPASSLKLSPFASQIFAIVFTIISGMVLLLLIAFCQRMMVAVRLIEEGARAVTDMPSLAFFPLSLLVSVLLLYAWSGLLGLFLLSSSRYDVVLGTYEKLVISPTEKDSCMQTLLSSNPLNVTVNSRTFSHSLSFQEAGRLCVLYSANSTMAIQGWQLGISTRLERAGGNYTGAEEMIAGSAARAPDLKGWMLGGFASSLPFKVSEVSEILWVLHVFLTCWSLAFVASSFKMIIAGAVGHWYYREGGDDEREQVRGLPLFRSLLRFICFHLGTAAFASLVLGLLWMTRFFMESNLKKLKQLRLLPLVAVLICIIQCCLSCLEKLVEFLSQNALIIAAVHGESFCWSAKRAMSLLMANILRMAAVSMVGQMLLLMGRLLICGLLVACAYLYMKNDPLDQLSALHSSTPVATLILVFVLSWFVSGLFMGVYWLVLDCVMLCYFDDSSMDEPRPITMKIEGRWKRKKLLCFDDAVGGRV